MSYNTIISKALFILAALCCLMPFMSPPIALALGFILAQFITHPYPQYNHQATNLLLKFSVVGLGFGMNLHTAIKAGEKGILLTAISIIGVLSLGFILGRVLKNKSKVSFLISAGTAICGGSAIAALSPVMKAGEKEISVALGIVFILNAAALLLFPAIGHALHLSQSQFGIWCAIAIHDTSSVVGAAGKYGVQALEIATTVKLARALWIIPVAFGTAFIFKSGTKKVQIPYFIGYFILAMCCNSYIPAIRPMIPVVVSLAKSGLTLTLFLIGSGLSLQVIRSVGIKPFLQGFILWISISAASLWLILNLKYLI